VKGYDEVSAAREDLGPASAATPADRAALSAWCGKGSGTPQYEHLFHDDGTECVAFERCRDFAAMRERRQYLGAPDGAASRCPNVNHAINLSTPNARR
jgi:hypothetical protein